MAVDGAQSTGNGSTSEMASRVWILSPLIATKQWDDLGCQMLDDMLDAEY